MLEHEIYASNDSLRPISLQFRKNVFEVLSAQCIKLLFAIGATNGTDEEVFERQRIEMLGWRRIVCNYQVNYWSTRSISGVK